MVGHQNAKLFVFGAISFYRSLSAAAERIPANSRRSLISFLDPDNTVSDFERGRT